MAETKLTYAQLEKQVAELGEQNKGLIATIEALEKQLAESKNQGLPNIKGFLLDVGNPFGDGVIRAYRRAGGKSNQPDRLPFVLPEKEEASDAALKNLILRADAAGDKARVEAARKGLPKKP